VSRTASQPGDLTWLRQDQNPCRRHHSCAMGKGNGHVGLGDADGGGDDFLGGGGVDRRTVGVAVTRGGTYAPWVGSGLAEGGSVEAAADARTVEPEGLGVSTCPEAP